VGVDEFVAVEVTVVVAVGFEGTVAVKVTVGLRYQSARVGRAR